MAHDLPLLYGELADWFPLLSPPEDYALEASVYRELLASSARGNPPSLLELGAGAGSNAFHLKRDFACTLTDLSPAMLEVSRRLNPECEHRTGDMRSLRLGRQFDAVFAHDALAYLTCEAELQQTVETAFAHCRPGGVALFAPDFVRETFQPGTEHGGSDGPQRSLRYLEWCWDPDPSDLTYRVEYVYLLREPGGEVRTVHDRHLEGCFPRTTWQRLLEQSGFRLLSAEHTPVEERLGELFLAQRPT